MLKEVAKVSPQVNKNITVPVSSSPKMSNIMQSIANSLPPHLSPVKITFTKPTIQTTSTTTQKVSVTWSHASITVSVLLQFSKTCRFPGDHCDDFSELQLCAQHPVQVSQQCHYIQTGLHLHSDHAPETDCGLSCQYKPLLQCQHDCSDHSGLLNPLSSYVNSCIV